MPPKADKLTQNLQSLQLFLQRKVGNDPELEPIILQLKNLEELLANQKLTLQIVSETETLAQALFDFLSEPANFSAAYRMKLDALPDLPRPVIPAVNGTLTLKCSLENTTEIERSYTLPLPGKVSLGRNPQADIVLDNPAYRGISWQHASVSADREETGEIIWRIEDTNSTNGTFVNHQPVLSPRILTPGDEITLANPDPSIGIVRLVFDCQTVIPENPSDDLYREVIDSDVLLLVTSLQQSLSERDIAFLKGIDTTLISKRFLVCELLTPEEESRLNTNNTQKINDLESWLKAEAAKSEFEILPVFLKPYYRDDYPKELEKSLQKKQDQFLKTIESIIKRQPENILASRLFLKLQSLLSPVEKLLLEERRSVQENIATRKQELEKLKEINLKEALKRATLVFNEDKDKFFKKVKLDLQQAKGGAIDNFSKKSIVYQVQEYVETLQPIVVKRDGQVYIQLSVPSDGVDREMNQVLIEFCFSWVERWGTNEWNKIISSYNNGGINALIERSRATFNMVPSLLDKTSFSYPGPIDVRDSLLMSFAGITCEVRHKQTSIVNYLMKEIRTNMMQYMMMITLLLAVVGIRGGKNQIFAKLSEFFKAYPWSLGIVIFAVFTFLLNAYNSDNQLKLEEAGEKLKKELTAYYQSLSKNLLEKIIQEFTVALDYELKKLEDTFSEIQSNYNDYILESEKQQVKSQANLDNYREKEKNIEKEIVEFQKLTRM